MTVARYHCQDALELALRLEGWQQESSQIEAGRFRGDIIDIVSPGLRLFRESANLGLSQHVHFPETQWHLIIPVHWPGGSLFSPGTVTVLPRCEQFWSVTPAHYDLLGLSIDRARYGWLARYEHRLRRLEVPAARLDEVRGQWQRMTAYLRGCPLKALRAPGLQQALSEQLEAGVQLLLDDGTPAIEPDITSYRTRRYIVDRCHALVRERPERPPTLMSLCHRLKISRRTLQYSFQAETGQSPSHYLRALRLNAVRRSLFVNPEQTLADAAAAQGFFHQSHFCREYRRLFQEPPSATRQRALAGHATGAS